MTAAMAAAMAPVTRAILLDRWQGVMKWERNLGNASEEYMALTAALDDLIAIVAGEDADTRDVLDEDVLDRIGQTVVDRIEVALGRPFWWTFRGGPDDATA